MKKTYSLTNPRKAPERHVEAIKSEIKKYLARERRKNLPAGNDFWIFDCKFGNTPEDATTIFANEVKPLIDQFVSEKKSSFYVEILSRPGKKPGKSA